jgi:hypothetical protein
MMETGLTLVTNATKHSTPMANVVRLNTLLIVAPVSFPSRALSNRCPAPSRRPRRRRICLGAVGGVTLLNVPCSGADLASRIVEQHLLLGRSHQAEKVARLLVVIVVDTMVPMCSRAFELQRRLVELRLVDPLAPAIGEVSGSSTEVAVSAHGTVAVVTVERAFRCIDGDVVMIDTQAVALRISVGEEPPLQHLVR